MCVIDFALIDWRPVVGFQVVTDSDAVPPGLSEDRFVVSADAAFGLCRNDLKLFQLLKCIPVAVAASSFGSHERNQKNLLSGPRIAKSLPCGTDILSVSVSPSQSLLGEHLKLTLRAMSLAEGCGLVS